MNFINVWSTYLFSVNRWTEPFDSTVYCVRSAGSHCLLSGMATYGMTRLWDKRMPGFVQVCIHLGTYIEFTLLRSEYSVFVVYALSQIWAKNVSMQK